MRTAINRLSPTQQSALIRVGAAMREVRDPWCLIGGAAALLHGVDIPELHDIDVLLSLRDAQAVLARLGLTPEAKTASKLFRSACFGTWSDPGIPVEFMADFAVSSGGEWVSVQPEPAETIRVGKGRIFLPSLEGLIAMYRLFGRDKDRPRIADLERLAHQRSWTEREI